MLTLQEFKDKDMFGCETRLGIYKTEYDAIPEDNLDAKQKCIYNFHKQEYAKWREIFG